MKKIAVVLIVLIVGATSCKKDDDLTREEMLSGGPWKQTNQKFNPTLPLTIEEVTYNIADFYEILNDCAKDDLFLFNSNGTYSAEEGATKCDPQAPEVFDIGLWSFNSDQTVLSITANFRSGSYSIEEISKSRMVLKTNITDTANNVYEMTEFFIRE